MARLRFKPRSTFIADLNYLAGLDREIIEEIRQAVDMLLEDGILPEAFGDHALKRRWSGYREFHIRDTPKGQQPNATNDVVVVYTINQNDLVLIAVRAGSHDKLFSNSHRS